MGNTIGDWTQAQLIRFVQNIIKEHPPKAVVTLSVDNLTAVGKLSCLDQIQFAQTQTTVGAAGSASALPGTPTGYIRIIDESGNIRVIPYYNVS